MICGGFFRGRIDRERGDDRPFVVEDRCGETDETRAARDDAAPARVAVGADPRHQLLDLRELDAVPGIARGRLTQRALDEAAHAAFRERCQERHPRRRENREHGSDADLARNPVVAFDAMDGRRPAVAPDREEDRAARGVAQVDHRVARRLEDVQVGNRRQTQAQGRGSEVVGASRRRARDQPEAQEARQVEVGPARRHAGAEGQRRQGHGPGSGGKQFKQSVANLDGLDPTGFAPNCGLGRTLHIHRQYD